MEFQSDNKLFVITAPSGSGKTTVMRSVMNNEIVSFTTRKKREGEIEGKDYIFITEQEFEKLLNTNGLIEHTTYGSNHYGITRAEYESKLSKSDCFFIADFNGMKQIRNIHKNTVTIFILCDKEKAENNMKSRGDSEENIKSRLSTYEQEIENMHHYTYVVNNNGDLETVIQDMRDIVYDI